MTVEPIYAFDIYADGRAVPLAAAALGTNAVDDVAYRWVHLDHATPETRGWIEANVNRTVAQSLTLEDTRPRCASLDGGVLLNLRGVNLNPESDPEDMVSIRLWVEPRLVISVRLRRLMAIVALREAIEAGRAPTSVGAFVTKLGATLTERMGPVIGDLADQVDALEEESLDARAGLRTQLGQVRRTTIMLRRYVGPQREALSRLTTDGKELLATHDQVSLRETIDQITRMVEEMDAIRERSAIVYDQLSDQRAEEMNRNMLILSVVAAIFLPLGFLTGLLGVNIAGIPGSAYPAAFALFCVLLTAIAGGLLWWFHKKEWI